MFVYILGTGPMYAPSMVAAENSHSLPISSHTFSLMPKLSPRVRCNAVSMVHSSRLAPPHNMYHWTLPTKTRSLQCIRMNIKVKYFKRLFLTFPQWLPKFCVEICCSSPNVLYLPHMYSSKIVVKYIHIYICAYSNTDSCLFQNVIQKSRDVFLKHVQNYFTNCTSNKCLGEL